MHAREENAFKADGKAQSAQAYKRLTGCVLALQQRVFAQSRIPIFDNFICGSRFELAVFGQATKTIIRCESRVDSFIRKFRFLRLYEQFSC